MTFRVVQLTDCHLYADPERAMNGVVTRPRLELALDDVRTRVPDFDLLVVTCDSASDEALATYEVFRDALGDWAQRLVIVPGNHDERAFLKSVFPDSCDDTGGRLTFQAFAPGWQLIGLDTQLTGEVAGELGTEQLTWLQDVLGPEPGLDTVIFLHHPPIEMGSPWLNRIGLRDTSALERVLDEHPCVRIAFTGHVHQETTGRLGNAAVHTTPAVGPQFVPDSAEFELEPGPPAYRIVELQNDGSWSTSVVRCG